MILEIININAQRQILNEISNVKCIIPEHAMYRHLESIDTSWRLFNWNSLSTSDMLNEMEILQNKLINYK